LLDGRGQWRQGHRPHYCATRLSAGQLAGQSGPAKTFVRLAALIDLLFITFPLAQTGGLPK
jgi:hypothetical protein